MNRKSYLLICNFEMLKRDSKKYMGISKNLFQTFPLKILSMNKMISLTKTVFISGFSLFLFLAEQKAHCQLKYIETHMHLQATYRDHGQLKHDWMGTAEQAIKEMDELGVSKCLIMPPPQGTKGVNPYEYEVLLPVIKKYPDRFALVAGGGSLNLMIQQAIEEGSVSDKMKMKFIKTAQEIVDAGAVAFGEMTALHLSFNPQHSFEVAPPDHPLFFELADISAKTGLPIDMHMEAVAKNISLPDWFKSPPNATMLNENISAFERLLEHNVKAKIVWQHVGWDNTGHLTITLLDSLLKKHSNLYIGLKCLQIGQSKIENRPLVNGKLKTEWIELIKKYPDRFMLGSDYFYVIPGKGKQMPDSSKESRMIVDQLPDGLKQKVAYINATNVYHLK